MLPTERSEVGCFAPTRRHSTFLRLLELAAPFKWWMALAVLFGSLTVGSSIGLLATSAYIIASAARHPSVADLAVPIVGVRFFGIARGVFRYLERYVSHYVNFSLLARLRVWFYDAIEPLAPARLMQYRSGDLLSRIGSDIETLQNLYVRLIAPPLVALAIAVLMGVFLSSFSTSLAMVVVGFMFLIGVIVPMAARHTSRDANRRLIAVRAELNAQLVDGIQGMADLIAFGREGEQTERVKASSRELVHWQGRMASITGLHNAVSNLLAHLAMWSALALAIPSVTSARLDGAYLPVLALAVSASFEGALALPLAFQYLETNLQAARRLFEIVDAKTFNSVAQGAPSAPLPIFGVANGNGPGFSLHVENLSFRYASNEPLALDDVSFDLHAGKSLAIVGPSGAGKSTLINLLLRFWDYEMGRIVLDGRNLRDYSPDAARPFFGVVSQPTHLFNATIRENLLLARPDASKVDMLRAAQQAQIHAFVSSLPQVYETMVGEQGLRLSGGERQRLAIARALLKNAPILLFDEPTANLDPVTEHAVLRAIHALLGNCTILLITHRLVGLDGMDEILVFGKGRVVERGSHACLLELDGVYRRMRDLQNRVLQDG